MTPVFINFSKQVVDNYKVKTVDPLEFEPKELGVPFAEIERRIINKEMEPLLCFPTSQVQAMRSAWENQVKALSYEQH